MQPNSAISRTRFRGPGAHAAGLAIVLGIAGTGGLAGPATAGDAATGLVKAAICASCHGPVGRSPIPSYPNIAGQNPLYLEYALHRYRDGERRGPQAGMMYTVTQSLSDADIADLAAYFAGLPPGR